MIPIIIKNRKYKVKPIASLTTAEFIELSKVEDLDIMKYIAWSTSSTMDDVYFVKISPVVEQLIGTIPDVTKLPPPAWAKKQSPIDMIGQRHQVERSGKEGLDLLVFVLAVAMARSNDEEKVNILYNCYMTLPFVEVLPAGFFFSTNLANGKNSDKISLRLSLHSMMNVISKLLRVLRGLMPILMRLKSRRFARF